MKKLFLDKLFAPLLAVFFVVAFCLTGCGSSSSGTTSSTYKTTVLVYMIGADLESNDSLATKNIQEMMAVGSTNNLNIVIQTGGAAKGPIADAPAGSVGSINWKKIQRYLVKKGSIQLVDDLGLESKENPLLNMGDGTTLRNFVEWGVGQYSADRYMVVLWDHGGGINLGIGPDQITGSSISVPQIRSALEQASNAKKVKFELVGFDTCLMATAEVAASLVNVGSYLVASQDLEPGGGWAYAKFLDYMVSNPSASAQQVGVKIADTYKDKFSKSNDSVTLSVTDLSKIPAVIKATNSLANALQKYTVNNLPAWKQIAYARVRSLDWSTYGILNETIDLVDLVQFSNNLSNNISRYIGPDSALSAASDEVALAVQSAVVHRIETGSNTGATGLAVYFPSLLSTYDNDKHKYASNTGEYFAAEYANGLNGFVKNYYDFYSKNKNSLIAKATKPTGDNYVSTIDNDIDYVLSAHMPKDQCSLYFGDKPEKEDCYDSMQLNESITQQGSGWDVNFSQNTWPMLNGLPVALISDQSQSVKTPGGENRYYLPVHYKLVTKDGESYIPGFLLLTQSLSNGVYSYKIMGFQTYATVPGKTYEIEKGNTFALSRYANTSIGFHFLRSTQEVTVGDEGLSFSFGAIGKTGQDQFGYIVMDLAGGVNNSLTAAY